MNVAVPVPLDRHVMPHGQMGRQGNHAPFIGVAVVGAGEKSRRSRPRGVAVGHAPAGRTSEGGEVEAVLRFVHRLAQGRRCRGERLVLVQRQGEERRIDGGFLRQQRGLQRHPIDVPRRHAFCPILQSVDRRGELSDIAVGLILADPLMPDRRRQHPQHGGRRVQPGVGRLVGGVGDQPMRGLAQPTGRPTAGAPCARRASARAPHRYSASRRAPRARCRRESLSGRNRRFRRKSKIQGDYTAEVGTAFARPSGFGCRQRNDDVLPLRPREEAGR